MIESTPRVISEEEAVDPSLVIGVCKCPVPTTYGHVFKKSDYPDGHISYVCIECSTKTDLIFKPGFFSRVTIGPFLD